MKGEKVYDKSKAYEITHRAWPCCVMKYCFMQTHVCRLKLDAAGEHLPINEGCGFSCIPITMDHAIQRQRDQPEQLFTWLIIFYTTYRKASFLWEGCLIYLAESTVDIYFPGITIIVIM